MSELNVLPKKWVEVKVDTQTRPIIGVDELSVRAVHNIHVPTHKAHLQLQNSRVAASVGQNEFYGIAIGDPEKALSKYVVSAFVDGVVSRKSLTKMLVEPNFVAAGAASAKANWVEDCSRAFGHERVAFTRPVIVSCFGGCGVVAWLEEDKTKT